jgi:hypothetical protein
VTKTGMHEHVCEQLKGIELGRFEEMKPKQAIQVYSPPFSGEQGEKHYYVYRKQIFSNNRYSVHISKL